MPSAVAGMVCLTASALIVYFGIVVFKPMSLLALLIYLIAAVLLAGSGPHLLRHSFFYLSTVGAALVFAMLLVHRVTRERNGADAVSPFPPRRDPAMEGHLWAVSFWLRVFGAASALIAVYLAVAERREILVVSLMTLALSGLIFTTGHFLARLHRWPLILLAISFLGQFLLSAVRAGMAVVESSVVDLSKGRVSWDLQAGSSVAFSLFFLSLALQPRAHACCTPETREEARRSPLEKTFKYGSRYFRGLLYLFLTFAALSLFRAIR